MAVKRDDPPIGDRPISSRINQIWVTRPTTIPNAFITLVLDLGRTLRRQGSEGVFNVEATAALSAARRVNSDDGGFYRGVRSTILLAWEYLGSTFPHVWVSFIRCSLGFDLEMPRMGRFGLNPSRCQGLVWRSISSVG
jgi:hypothetical protein